MVVVVPAGVASTSDKSTSIDAQWLVCGDNVTVYRNTRFFSGSNAGECVSFRAQRGIWFAQPPEQQVPHCRFAPVRNDKLCRWRRLL